MPRIAPVVSALCVLAFAWLAPAPAEGAIIFVSGLGNDTTGDGSQSNPFKTLQKAADEANSDDTIIVGAPGTVGPVVINNKTLSIIAVTGAGIFSPGTHAITFNGGANRELTLRGLTIDQGGDPFSGILFNSGRKMNVFDTTIQNGSGNWGGITFRSNTASELNVRNNTINGFGTSGAGSGINIAPRNGADVTGTVSDSTLSNNRSGVRVFSGTGVTANLIISNNIITGGGTGISASGVGSQIVVDQSTITHNALGVQAQDSAQIRTRVNNTMFGNAIDGTFTGTQPPR
jgi:hypothetical protein